MIMTPRGNERSRFFFLHRAAYDAGAVVTIDEGHRRVNR